MFLSRCSACMYCWESRIYLGFLNLSLMVMVMGERARVSVELFLLQHLLRVGLYVIQEEGSACFISNVQQKKRKILIDTQGAKRFYFSDVGFVYVRSFLIHLRFAIGGREILLGVL